MTTLTDKELEKALFAMEPEKAAGWDEVPVELKIVTQLVQNFTAL